MRYSEWYYHQFPIQLMDYFDKIITIGNNKIYDNTDKSMFSPIDMSVKYQTEQIDQFINTELYSDDILLFMDLSFPGVFQQYLYHKRPYKAYCFCHATSINYLDYFSKINQNYNNSKFINELSNLLLFDKVFVATNYHKNKILNYASTIFNSVKIFEDKITVLGALPITPKSEDKRIPFSEKENDISPPILHTSPTGSIERVLCAILEKIAMDDKPQFPLWLSPTQVRIIPVGEEHLNPSIDLVEELSSREIRVDIDDRDRTVGKRIRRAEKDWVPYRWKTGIML